MLTEFGGIAFPKRPEPGVTQTWGYTAATTEEQFTREYSELWMR